MSCGRAANRHNDAVIGGVAACSGVVTSAAVIMVAVFSIFATLSLIELKMIGVGLAVRGADRRHRRARRPASRPRWPCSATAAGTSPAGWSGCRAGGWNRSGPGAAGAARCAALPAGSQRYCWQVSEPGPGRARPDGPASSPAPALTEAAASPAPAAVPAPGPASSRARSLSRAVPEPGGVPQPGAVPEPGGVPEPGAVPEPGVVPEPGGVPEPGVPEPCGFLSRAGCLSQARSLSRMRSLRRRRPQNRALPPRHPRASAAASC